MPTCRDMSELVTEYLERTTAPQLRASMWWHLLRCEACRRYYDQVRRTVLLVGRGPRQSPDSSTEDSVLSAARTERQRET